MAERALWLVLLVLVLENGEWKMEQFYPEDQLLSTLSLFLHSGYVNEQ